MDNYGLSHTDYKIKHIFRIENPVLWTRYCQHKGNILSDMANKVDLYSENETSRKKLNKHLSKSANEMYLWHGTKPKIKNIIQATGFDERVASNGLFEHGIYFAENFSKSDEYVTPDCNGTAYMFLSRVTMGNIAHINKGQGQRKRPPCVKEIKGECNGVCNHIRFHSLLAEKGPGCYLKKYREYIVYDRNQCYPEYLVEYRRVQ